MDRKQILMALSHELALKRSKAQNKALQNRKIALLNKDFVDLDQQEKQLTLEIGKLKAFDNDCTQQIKKLEAVHKKMDKTLFLLGLSKEDLLPQYECKDCDDTGYINGQMCHCLKNQLTNRLIKEFGSKDQNLHSFSSFNADLAQNEDHRTQLLKLKKKFEQIIENYPSKDCPNFIVLSGQTGVGKTFLTECLANELIYKGSLVSFVSAFAMNNMFLAYHTTFDSKKQDYIDALLSPDVLIIDDLGTEPTLKNVTKEYLYLILSERSRLNKLTVISTNLDLENILARYNERIFSRLCNKRESFIAQIKGTDLRLNSKK